MSLSQITTLSWDPRRTVRNLSNSDFDEVEVCLTRPCLPLPSYLEHRRTRNYRYERCRRDTLRKSIPRSFQYDLPSQPVHDKHYDSVPRNRAQCDQGRYLRIISQRGLITLYRETNISFSLGVQLDHLACPPSTSSSQQIYITRQRKLIWWECDQACVWGFVPHLGPNLLRNETSFSIFVWSPCRYRSPFGVRVLFGEVIWGMTCTNTSRMARDTVYLA